MYYAFITLGSIMAYGTSKQEALDNMKAMLKGPTNKLTVENFEKKGPYSMETPLILEMSEELYNIISKEKDCMCYQDFIVCTNKEGVSKLQTVDEPPFFMKSQNND